MQVSFCRTTFSSVYVVCLYPKLKSHTCIPCFWWNLFQASLFLQDFLLAGFIFVLPWKTSIEARSKERIFSHENGKVNVASIVFSRRVKNNGLGVNFSSLVRNYWLSAFLHNDKSSPQHSCYINTLWCYIAS